METKTETKKDVKGLPSRAAADRLAAILLVVPTGVLAFQTEDPSHVELRTAERCAVLDVTGEGVTLVTRVGTHEEWEATGEDDVAVARRLIRFFG